MSPIGTFKIISPLLGNPVYYLNTQSQSAFFNKNGFFYLKKNHFLKKTKDLFI